MCTYVQVLLYKKNEFDVTSFIAEYKNVPDGNNFYIGDFDPDQLYFFQVYIYTVFMYVAINIVNIHICMYMYVHKLILTSLYMYICTHTCDRVATLLGRKCSYCTAMAIC